MLIAEEHFRQLALIPLLITFAPVVAGIVWARRNAAWFRALSATRQLGAILGLTVWFFGVGSIFLNYREWLDIAEVWVVRDGPLGIVKDDLVLIGTAEYRMMNGKSVTLHADAQHYRFLINASKHTLRRDSAYYGRCDPKSLATLTALMRTEPALDIPPGEVLDNPWHGGFGSGPPHEITVITPQRDMTDVLFGRCEQRYWYSPVEGSFIRQNQQGLNK